MNDDLMTFEEVVRYIFRCRIDEFRHAGITLTQLEAIAILAAIEAEVTEATESGRLPSQAAEEV